MPDRSLPPVLLRVVEGVLLLAVLVTLVTGVARPLLGQAGLGLGRGPYWGAELTVPVTLAPGVEISTTPDLPALGGDPVERGDGLALVPGRSGEVVVLDPDLRQRAGLAVAPALRGAITATVLLLLLPVVRGLRRDDPVGPLAARRLLTAAVLVGAGGTAVELLALWSRLGVIANPQVSALVEQGWHVSVSPLEAGLGIAVVAEVLRRATAREADHSPCSGRRTTSATDDR